MIPTCRIYIGDVREKLRELPDNSVQCVVTSPPYWNLRDYGVTGQIGLEKTFDEFLSTMVEVFRAVRRVLRKDGVCWVNMGDCYCGSSRGEKRFGPVGSKPKDLVGQPWRLAFALQADGWWLRQDIIWHKPNPMPESISDRCTKSHEYIFLLTKADRYFFDAAAIREPVSGTAHARGDGVNPKADTGVGWGYAEQEKPRTTKPVSGWDMGRGSHDLLAHAAKQKGREEHGLRSSAKFGREAGWRQKKCGKNSRVYVDRDPAHQTESKIRAKQNRSFSAAVTSLVDERNKRSVWSIPTEAYSEAHYATFPRDLVRPCVLAGSRLGDTVLDPFGGSGTTAAVALEYGRNAILIDLNPVNEALMHQRILEFNGAGVLPLQ